MKKILSNSVKCLLIASLMLIPVAYKAQLNFSIAPNTSTLCTMGSPWNPSGQHYLQCTITSTVPGATYYTYTLSAGCSVFVIFPGSTSTVGIWANSPGTHTVTCLAYASNQSSVVLGTANQTIFAIPGPTVTVSGPMQVCPNSANTYTASGANTYTWVGQVGGPLNGAVNTMTAGGSSGNFTISATASNGCTNTNPINVTVGAAVVTISSPTVCPGGTSTLAASGALTYTWSNGSIGASIIVSPSVTTTYSLAASNANCTFLSTHVVAVSGFPVITAGGAQTICQGQSAQLTASGAQTYSWSNGAGGGNINVSPLTSTCYTVTGINSPGCAGNSSVICITVNTSPTIIAVGSGSVCLGSSITFTASGGTTYTWTSGSTGAINNIVPTGSGILWVTGGWNTNSCTGTDSVFVAVNIGCAIVWPGDANRDGVANNTDVLELGLMANSTGPARTPTSIAWSGQLASAWNNTLSTGWNRCHADCNGDGVVNGTDAAAVTLNFGQTHTFRSSSSAGNDISLVPQKAVATAGEWNIADILLGDASNNLTQVYGVAFDLNYDQNMVETDAVNLVYTASFLKGTNQTIEFGKTIFASGKIFAAIVRTDQVSMSGNGKIGELWYKVKTGLPANSTINLSATNALMVNHLGTKSVLGATAPVNQIIVEASTVGLTKVNTAAQLVRIFPNPAQDKLNLVTSATGITNYSVSDITGRVLMNGNLESSATVDISNLNNGTYFVKFASTSGESVTKLVIVK